MLIIQNRKSQDYVYGKERAMYSAKYNSPVLHFEPYVTFWPPYLTSWITLRQSRNACRHNPFQQYTWRISYGVMYNRNNDYKNKQSFQYYLK